MSVSRYLSREIKKVDKRRTLSILGFLVILAFFPVIFSSSNQRQETRTQAAPISNQVVTSVTPAIIKTQAPGGSQQQVAAPITPSASDPSFTDEGAYSPQPSIWLFIIPIAVTFFTILFY